MGTHPTYVGGILAGELSGAGHPDRVMEVMLGVMHNVRLDADARELEKLDVQIEGVSDQLRTMTADKRPAVRAGAAELIFSRGDPIGQYQAMERPQPEVTYALLYTLARNPPADADLGDLLEVLAPFRDHEMPAVAMMANVAVWSAYGAVR